MDNLAASIYKFKLGAFHGLLTVGIFLLWPIVVNDEFFERKRFKYMAVKAGFWMISLALMGGIIAAMFRKES
ncbi:MAG: DUF1761 domain-containing protein [Saprospiraceae bacterium]|nr:DUF1761 domain-containing protein [Saprospiraceae bacterium]